MIFKITRTITILVSFNNKKKFFLTGFIPFLTIIGPSVTAISSGNIYKASAQLIIDQSIKKTTGKNSLALVKDEIDKKKQKDKLNEELKKLVENRIKMTRKKLNLDNIIQ